LDYLGAAASEDVVLSEDVLQSAGIELSVLGDVFDDVGEVCKEVTLVLVCENGWDASVVEFYVLIVHFDEVEGGMCWDEGFEGGGDDLGYRTLFSN
jgi:hypothetical protein